MKVENLAEEIATRSSKIDEQNLYVTQLEQLDESGQETIEVYDLKFTRNTKMSLTDFIKLQESILDELVPERDELQALYNKFQAELDSTLEAANAGKII